jgi:hypothetical protein
MVAMWRNHHGQRGGRTTEGYIRKFGRKDVTLVCHHVIIFNLSSCPTKGRVWCTRCQAYQVIKEIE